jgi:hypothetical protein
MRELNWKEKMNIPFTREKKMLKNTIASICTVNLRLTCSENIKNDQGFVSFLQCHFEYSFDWMLTGRSLLMCKYFYI